MIMSNPFQKIGKIDHQTFSTVLASRFGREDPAVIVPPMAGAGTGVVDIGDGKVLIAAEEPAFSFPGLSLTLFGYIAVHIGASNVAVMGVPPQYLTYSLLLPPEIPDNDLRRLIDAIHQTAAVQEIAIVGEHTGYYPGFEVPAIGGIAVFAVADRGAYVTPGGAQPGDDIILTKGPAIGATGILSVLWENDLLKKYPRTFVDQGKSRFTEMTVIKDALAVSAAGGVTAMYGAAEGGVLGGLFEIAHASNVGMEIFENQFVYPDEVRMIAEMFGIDPVAALAEGSLLITARPTFRKKIHAVLDEARIPASVIGRVLSDPGRRVLHRCDGSEMALAMPDRDPFWPVFFRSLEGVSPVRRDRGNGTEHYDFI